jgi:hypothetical protein
MRGIIRLRGIIYIGVAVGVAAILAHAVLTHPLFPSPLRVGINTLEVAPVGLGEIDANSTRQFDLVVANRGLRTVVLLPPGTSCGCILLERGETTIPGRSSRVIKLQVRAPSSPGRLAKEITLSARDYPDLQWTVPVTGEIVARAWADPPSVNLEYEGEVDKKTRVILHHRDGVSIGQVLTSTPELALSTTESADDSLVIEVKPDVLKKGACENAIIQVFGSPGNDELLRIPVAWRPRPHFRCVPGELLLEGPKESSKELEKTLHVLTSDKDKGAVTIEPLVPWVGVTEVEKKPFGLVVHLKVDSKHLPSEFDGPILRFRAEGIAPFLFSARITSGS